MEEKCGQLYDIGCQKAINKMRNDNRREKEEQDGNNDKGEVSDRKKKKILNT